jgi:hypothetical protein
MVQQSKTERDLTILLRYIKSTFGKQEFKRSDVLDFMEENNIPNPIYAHLVKLGPFTKTGPCTYAVAETFKKGEIARIVEWVAVAISDEARNRSAMKRAGDDGYGEPSEDDKSLLEIAQQKDIAKAIMLLQDNGFTISIVI